MITQQQARNLHLAAQGLLQAPARAAKRSDVAASVQRMGLLQIDTIHVVARSPYLVLFSRLGHYPRQWLEDALAQGQLFETWAHEACFAPASDLLHHRAYNRDGRKHWGLGKAEALHATQRPHLDKLLAHIAANGPVKSSDFERPEGSKGGAWWAWKDEKRWLETLFGRGELMVRQRDKFHRVYDLTSRVAPEALLAEQGGHAPTGVQAHQQFITQSIAALGICQARWVNDYYRLKPRLKDADLDALVADGTVVRVDVEGWDAPGYVHSAHAALLKKALKGQLLASHTSLLSPFDPVVWDRERASTLFDFDYRLECYTPEPKRVYGYFVLPILCQGELIGRLDAKAHRSEGVFEVKALHCQGPRPWSELQIKAVAQALVECAQWHDTPTVNISQCRAKGLKLALQRAVKMASVQASPSLPQSAA
ncbi:winged helix-turn-helix domain-containing protein [Rhodoferax aquaticus]|uniref:Winged helix-turn-helix domain-containing protein n=1 Tax=Rhodoferax aquaticus TaxID=2527691 RepID=A0A515ESU9_9BURK|nr:crosslink repair DNA glycosylase YcaQ family protein [Rhodoferax aquaticus]QDL55752.1 winged helix-turn-helix domain-containing protein [Rhodoferax aquaticus]